jgi:hypothetical protein
MQLIPQLPEDPVESSKSRRLESDDVSLMRWLMFVFAMERTTTEKGSGRSALVAP